MSRLTPASKVTTSSERETGAWTVPWWTGAPTGGNGPAEAGGLWFNAGYIGTSLRSPQCVDWHCWRMRCSASAAAQITGKQKIMDMPSQKDRDICNQSEDTKPGAPSFFLSLEPFALGTDAAESLGSYLERLATAQGFTVGQMFHGARMEVAAKASFDVARLVALEARGAAAGAASTCEAGHRAVEALAQLVGGPEISRLHLAHAVHGFSFHRFTRGRAAWCAACVATDVTPYRRLLWEIGLVSACPRHGCRLDERCPSCGRSLPGLDCAIRFPYCPRCHGPLGGLATTNASPAATAVAQELGRWVAAATGDRLSGTGSGAVASLLAWAAANGAKSIRQQSRLLGVQRSLLHYWRKGSTPSLQRVLEICLRMGLSTLAVCGGAGELGDKTGPRPAPVAAWQFRRLGASRRKEIRAELHALALHLPPLTLASLARRSGVTVRTLRSIDPKGCAQVRDRGEAWRRKLHERKERWFRHRIASAAAELVASGRNLTIRAISDQLSKPGILRQPSLNRYARELIVARQSVPASTLLPPESSAPLP